MKERRLVVAPEIGLPFLSQKYDKGVAPSAITLNFATLPAPTVFDSGFSTTNGANARAENDAESDKDTTVAPRTVCSEAREFGRSRHHIVDSIQLENAGLSRNHALNTSPLGVARSTIWSFFSPLYV